jgi:hypothetical protein
LPSLLGGFGIGQFGEDLLAERASLQVVLDRADIGVAELFG